MTRIRFENLPSTNTPRNAENLNKLNNVVISSTEPTTGEEVWLEKGKNLFNKNVWQYGYISGDGNFVLDSDVNAAFGYIEVSPSTTYKFTLNSVYGFRYSTFDANKNFIGRSDLYQNSITINTSSTTKYIIIVINVDNETINQSKIDLLNAQLEQGSTATTYEAYIDKKIYTKNDNGVYEEFYDESNNVLGSISAGETTTSSSLKTVQNANYEVLSGISKTINTKKNISTILVFISVGGVWNNNTGYDVGFNVKMDDSILSNSGARLTNAGDWRANWSTDGASKIRFNDVFVFTNVPKGEHSFNIIWTSSNANVTAYCGNYGRLAMTAVEI